MSTSITVTAAIAAHITDVWLYWTNPDYITKWNFATDDWCCPHAINDLRVGGKYMARMEAKDGSLGFDFEAVYDKVLPREEIVYTIADGRKVTITFRSLDKVTIVTTVFDVEDQYPVEMQQQGWQAILNNFKKYAESDLMSD